MYLLRRFGHSVSGGAAIEFAIIVPFFILCLIGIFEIGIVLVFNLYLNNAANAGVEYLRSSQIHGTKITNVGLRDAVSSAMPVELDRSKLHVRLTRIDNADLAAVRIHFPVSNGFSVSKTGDFLLQVGYDWRAISPMTKYLVPHTKNKIQLQAIQLGAAAVRVTE